MAVDKKSSHPADSEQDTPRSIEIPPELRAAPSERAAAILLELVQIREAMQDLSAEFRRSKSDDDARYKKLEARVRELEEELTSVKEELLKIKVANDQDLRERTATMDAIKKYIDTLEAARAAESASMSEALNEVRVAAQDLKEYRAESATRNVAFLRFATVQDAIVEDLGYEFDENGVLQKPKKPTKLTQAAEANRGARAAIVLLMLQIIWQVMQAVNGGSPPPVRHPPTFERSE
jgi:hypothetical protein